MESKERRPKIQIDYKKIGMVVAAIILFFLVMDLNNRLNELSRLSVEKDRSSTQVAVLEQTLSKLQTQIYYATSESSVEQWAYEEGHLAKPGDSVVIPIAPPGATQQAMVVATPPPTKVSNWDIWMALIFNR